MAATMSVQIVISTPSPRLLTWSTLQNRTLCLKLEFFHDVEEQNVFARTLGATEERLAGYSKWLSEKPWDVKGARSRMKSTRQSYVSRFTPHVSRFLRETAQETEKITSISTEAPRGNSAAPTAARA